MALPSHLRRYDSLLAYMVELLVAEVLEERADLEGAGGVAPAGPDPTQRRDQEHAGHIRDRDRRQFDLG
jgi:hypothetical protein